MRCQYLCFDGELTQATRCYSSPDCALLHLEPENSTSQVQVDKLFAIRARDMIYFTTDLQTVIYNST